MQGKQISQGKNHGRDRRLMRMVKGQGRFTKFAAIIFVSFLISMLGCSTMQAKETKDSISNLSFSYDGKKVFFDRCRDGKCQTQVYDLETGELAAYQSPKGERWTMARQSYDGKRITFAVIPVKFLGDLDLGNMQIAVMDTDGKNYRKVTTGPGAKLYPTFSHSGDKVLYACTRYIRTQGQTPAADYDAWEIDLSTGRQTQLTFFKYFYMNSLAYFPDDERFIYYGDKPRAFPGLDLSHVDPMKGFEMTCREQMKRNVAIGGVIVMKKGDALPREHYDFGKDFYAQNPLLSKDGSKLIVEKDISGGKFFLYSPDGKHRLVCERGSVDSASISPDGVLLGICRNDSIHVSRVSDDLSYRGILLKRPENWDEYSHKMPHLRLLQEVPSRIIKTND